MRPHIRFLHAPLLLLAVAPSLDAQGVLQLQGDYRLLIMGGDFGVYCAPTDPIVFAEHGTCRFDSAGTFAITLSDRRVCPNGQVHQVTSQHSGQYVTRQDSRLVMNFTAGGVLHTFPLRPDGEAFLGTRETTSDEPWANIAIRLDPLGGQTVSSLQGTYHVLRTILQNEGMGLSAVSELGTMVFDGAGGYVENGVQRAVDHAGVTTTTAYNAVGAYSVAPDGSLNAGSTRDGALSNDGEFFAWVERDGQAAGLTIGLRRGVGANAALLEGEWGVALQETRIGPTSADLEYYTYLGDAALIATSLQAGTFTANGLAVETRMAGTTGQTVAETGTFTVSGQGELTLINNNGSPHFEGATNERGTVAVLRTTGSGAASMGILVREGSWPNRYGTATPGSGGFAPTLVPTGGFPILGNAGLGLWIAQALGNSSALIVISMSPAPGVPFLGGLLWVDPSSVVPLPIRSLSGTPGVPGVGSALLSTPIPFDPVLDGAFLYLQGFVLDPGVSQGLAMTTGLRVQIGR